MTHRHALAGLLLIAAGCARSRAESTATVAPSLERIAPDTIAIGQGAIPTLTLTGRGFAPGAGGNTVRVGPAEVLGVDADSSGTTMRVVLPLTYTDTASRGRPSGFLPGRYDVIVVTSRGASNPLTLTMIR
ncbi:MAG: hypothetical protein IT361_02780 [Gemmatimonadaceae bacterium]|nr:hypothetical protein [Gemmatimonadaceae bacterium]